MTLRTTLRAGKVALTDAERERIERHLAALERRLEHYPEPAAELVLEAHAARRQVEAALRVQLGPLGAHLIGHQSAATADQAVRRAVEDIERQLERKLAQQRGEPSYGVPSRREPADLRPHPPPPAPRGAASADEEAEEKPSV